MLLQCSANADGVLPGDKYGYIDTFWTHGVYSGEEVVSVWQNRVEEDRPSLGTNYGTILVSEGIIDSTYGHAWCVPSCETGSDNGSFHSTLYSNGGASGSPWLFRDWGLRTLVSPTSTGGNEGLGTARNGRSAAPLESLFSYYYNSNYAWAEEFMRSKTEHHGLTRG